MCRDLRVVALVVGGLMMYSPSAFAQESLSSADVDRLVQDKIGTIEAPVSAEVSTKVTTLAEKYLNASQAASGDLDRDQIILVVDRDPAVQRMFIEIRDASGVWQELGAFRVSTGKPGRREHFVTPVGVFLNDGSHMGYRALGTKNENGIRGIGRKGSRVWDFGWQTTEDWRTRGAVTAVRMEMHATDPDILERRLGSRDSEGCIRIPTALNVFLDRYGIVDGSIQKMVPTSKAWGALLAKASPIGDLSGDKLVVVDTSNDQAVASDPVQAENINSDFAKMIGRNS